MLGTPDVRSAAPADDVAPDAAAFLRLLADPTRRRIFLQLMAGETCNCELVDVLGLAQNLISHHVRQLRVAGLVAERRDPQDRRWIYYRVVPEALEAAWASLTGTLHPSRLGTREPVCGPAARDSLAAGLTSPAPAPPVAPPAAPGEERCCG
jgi:DNA-binding transcriptional ArsR family regulator